MHKTASTAMALISKARVEDMQFRRLVMECAEISLRWYSKTKDPASLEYAKQFGTLSNQLKKRIETHDYKEEDARQRRLDEMDRNWGKFVHSGPLQETNSVLN